MQDLESGKRLWQRVVEGDEAAFSELYQTYFSSLYHYGYRLYPDDTFVEDCLHDFFLYLHSKRSNLSPVISLQAYLFRSFRRTVLRKVDKMRKEMAHHQAYLTEEEDIDLSFESLLMEQERSSMARRLLKGHLDSLAPRQKEIIYLKFFDNLSYQEIAQITDLSYQTVVNHLNKALAKLRQLYKTAESIAASLLLAFWFMG